MLEGIAIYDAQTGQDNSTLLNIEHYSNVNNIFPSEAPDNDRLSSAFINCVMQRYSDFALHSTTRKESDQYFPASFNVDTPSEMKIIIGGINHTSLVSSYKEVYAPEEVSLQLSGLFLDSQQYIDITNNGQLNKHATSTKVVSATAELTITWLFDPTYSGDPNNEFANAIFWPRLILTSTCICFYSFSINSKPDCFRKQFDNPQLKFKKKNNNYVKLST